MGEVTYISDLIYIRACKLEVAAHLLQDGPQVREAAKRAGLSIDKDLLLDEGFVLGFTLSKAKRLLDPLNLRVMTLAERESIIPYAETNHRELYEDMTSLLHYELLDNGKGSPLVLIGGDITPGLEKELREDLHDYSFDYPLRWLGVRPVRDRL